MRARSLKHTGQPMNARRQWPRRKTPGSAEKTGGSAMDIGDGPWRSPWRFLSPLTVRTVKCNSYCVTQTRATRSQRPGTETGRREDHMVDWHRERGDARARGSHEERLRCNVERRSQELTSFPRSSRGVLAKCFSRHRHTVSKRANWGPDHRRYLDPTTIRGLLEQAVETLLFSASVDYHADPKLRQ